MNFNILEGDALARLSLLPSNSVDSICTDPPYGIKFMAKRWDYDIPGVAVWLEVYRVLKPGGYVLCACGTRTQHRMSINIEDAGFEIRDVITWHYGSGFPKSFDLENVDSSFKGQGTALKPATEFWTLARKLIEESTVANNVIKYGTGGLNIDGCRIETEEILKFGSRQIGDGIKYGKCEPSTEGVQNVKGRFPANVIFDEFTGALLDEQTGILKTGKVRGNEPPRNITTVYGVYKNRPTSEASQGGASRFFYCAKASQSERDLGLEEFAKQYKAASNQAAAELAKGNTEFKSDAENAISFNNIKFVKNFHPTVKPIKLMRYLTRLITPKGGTVLDPYSGSGSTGCACMLENFNYLGIELETEYITISQARISYYFNLQLSKWLL